MELSNDTPIAVRFREIAAAHADVAALASPRARITYAELDRWSDAVAADLVASGAPLDRPLAILTRDPVALVPAALGAVKAGHFFVVIDANDTEERIATLLETSGAVARITDEDVERRSAARRASTGAVPPHATPHELVQLVFTSGTTGTPKAIASRQRGFVARNVASSAVTGRTAGERVSYTALPGFARATYEVFGSLLNGATLCAWDARTESLDALGAMIERERVSVLTLTPALFRRFMMTARADLDLSSVRRLRIGADVVTVADIDAYKARFPRGCTLERGFNASETGLVMHLSIDHDTQVEGPLVPIGRPRPNVHVRLIDEEGNDVPDGVAGELVVRGPNVVEGYWNAPEQTAQKFRFDPDGTPTFFTGDLVKRGADGLYYFVGRRDSRLKIHGRRIDPLEVESALVAHTGVREAVAVGKPSPDGELRLVAYVVMRGGAACVPRDIRAALRDHLPAWLIPSRIYALDAMPMARSGKVDRDALTQRVETDAGDEHAPADALERTLADLWSRVLGTPAGVDDDFFDDLGGESVVAMHLVAEVERLTGRALPLSLLLELNTVAKMSDYLRTSGDTQRLVVVVQKGGTRPPLFCVSGRGGSVIIFRQLAALLGEEQPFYGLTHEGFPPERFPKTFAALAACYVDAIRAVQPSGPYLLAGYSAGGVVAFDVARQLTLIGETVAFVGLIDTAVQDVRTPAWRRALKHVELLWERPRRNAPRYAKALANRVTRVGRWLSGKGWTFPPPPFEKPAASRAYEAIRKRESLQPYPGKVTLFVARHGRGYGAEHRDLGWAPLCRGGLEIVTVEGEHSTVIRDDVESLAGAFRRALAAAASADAAATATAPAEPPVPASRT